MNKDLIIFAPFIEKGGIEKNIFILTNYLLNNLNKVSLITCDKNIGKKFKKNLKIISLNKKFLITNNRLIKNFSCLILLIITILSLNRKCVIFSFQSNLYVTLIAKLLGVRNIIRVAVYGWMFSSIKRIIFKLILPLSTRIIVNSKEMKRILKKKLKVKAEYIYNPLSTKDLDSSKNTKKKFFKDQKNLKILFLGRLVDQKDPFTFLKSLKLISNRINYEALIVGSGNLKDKITKYINENNLKFKVKLIIFKANPSQYLNQCDLFILTSKYEGLPNVLLEAQYLKKYIISTNCKTGPKEILKNGKLGDLINIGNYKKLSHNILKYNVNRKKLFIRNKINDAYKETNRFNYKINCKKYLKLIKKYL